MEDILSLKAIEIETRRDRDIERLALIKSLEKFVNEFDWSIEYHREKMVDSETGEINDYHQDSFTELVERKDLRLNMVNKIVDIIDTL